MRAVRPRLARAAGIARGLAAVLGVLSGLAGGWLLPEPVAAQTAGICDRTLEVRDLIVRSVPGIAHCRDVTADHLAGIELLYLDSRQNRSVQTGDFAGLSNLQTLRLTVLGQRSMSGDMFSGLNELKHLSLSFGSPLTTLPANLFSGLSSLERLEVFSASSLTTLPANLFSGLDGLRALSLVDNRLIGLPAGIFSGLDRLRALSLEDNRLTRLPAGIFTGLTGLTHLYTSGNAFDLYLDLELERVGTGPLQAGSALRFRVKAVQGAPFAIPVTWQARASSGLVNGKASVSGSVTIPKGSISSGTFSLNGTADGGTPPAIALAVTSPGLRSSIPSVDYHPLGIDLRSGSSTNYRGFYFSTPPRIDLNFRDARSVTKSTLSIADAFAQEGNPVEFKVKLSSAVSSDVVVNWATSHDAGSAAAGSNDYTSGSGSLTIPTGQTSGTITVRTTEDIVPEGHETFTLTLSAPGGLPNPVALARKAATGTIFNDDAVLSLSNARGKEGDAINFYVRFSREIFVARGTFEVVGRVTRHIGTTPGDFRTGQCVGRQSGGRSGNLYRTNSGITCDLEVNSDLANEPDEAFEVKLVMPRRGYPGMGITLSQAAATGTIENVAPVTLTIRDAQAEEGGVVSFDAALDKAADYIVSLYWEVRSGTATSADYYTSMRGFLNIRAGRTAGTIRVHTRDDTVPEPDETFVLDWSSMRIYPLGVGLKLTNQAARPYTESTSSGTETSAR